MVSSPEPCPPQAGCWYSRLERQPHVRLIVLGNGPRFLMQSGSDLGYRNSPWSLTHAQNEYALDPKSSPGEAAQSPVLRHVLPPVCLELRSFPPPEFTRFPRYYGTSPPPQSARPVPHGRPVGPVIPDLTTLWGFPCCARFPCVRAAATHPGAAAGRQVLACHLTQPYQPSPITLSDRPAHRPFRGPARRSLALRPAHLRRSTYM